MRERIITFLHEHAHHASKVEHAGFVSVAFIDVIGVHQVMFIISVVLLISGGISLLFDK